MRSLYACRPRDVSRRSPWRDGFRDACVSVTRAYGWFSIPSRTRDDDEGIIFFRSFFFVLFSALIEIDSIAWIDDDDDDDDDEWGVDDGDRCVRARGARGARAVRDGGADGAHAWGEIMCVARRRGGGGADGARGARGRAKG